MTETSSTQPSAGAGDPDLAAGQVVGEYQVESKLGQGGFGAVFKAVHPLIGKVVAIKVLARKFSADPEMVSRFVAEARAVNQIRHRNIIDIFSFGQLTDGRHYYVMEYLDGEPLDRLIDRERLLAPAVALPILRAVSRALDAAHGKGIAHRDLKPENVFLAKDLDGDGGYFPKLLDFGIAKLLAATDDGNKVKTRTGIPIGTPYYMSPEQCRGKDVDHRTDYYAFGVVAYQMLTGVYPIDGEDYMSILMSQMADEPRRASQVNPALPPGVDDAIAWLMHKDPAQRPPNLATAVRALEAAVEAGGIPIPRGSWEAATPVPTPGTLERPPTPPAAGARGTGHAGKTPQALAPTMQGGKTPHAFAETVPSGSAPEAVPTAPTRRGLLRWIVGGLSAAALAGGAVLVMSMQHGDRSTPGVAAIAPPQNVAADASMTVAVVVPPTVDAAVVVGSADEVATVEIKIEHAPEGSEVVRGSEVLGVTPGPVLLPHGTAKVELVVRHAGYTSATLTVVPDHARTLDATLKPIVRPQTDTPSHPSHDPHGIENPFGHH